MSYDLMVFEASKAPHTQEEFLEWYDKQTEWEEEHDYEDPEITSPTLREWFMEIIQTFPQMNGPFAPLDDEIEDETYLTDYSIGKNIIYAGFSWSLADEAYDLVRELSEKYKVGFFDASGNGDIIYPDGTVFSHNEDEDIEEEFEYSYDGATVYTPVKKFDGNFKILADMYKDDYYPDFLVDKIAEEIKKVITFLENETHTYDEIQKKFDTMTIAINDLEEEFDENDSEIETVARESIGGTVDYILAWFDIKIDVEEAIGERNW